MPSINCVIGRQVRILFSLLITAVIIAEIRSDCLLSKSILDRETRLYYDLFNNEPRILLTDRVLDGRSIYAFCAENDIIKIDCNGDAFNYKLPIGNCNADFQYALEQVWDSTCGYDVYRAGFRTASGFLEILRTCYDKTFERSIWTRHIAYYYEVKFKRPPSCFSDGGIVGPGVQDIYSDTKIFDRFQELLGYNQGYMSKNTRGRADKIDKGHMAPCIDFMLDCTKCSTFFFTNIVPQFHTVNIGNWKRIESWVQNQISYNNEARVVSAAYATLQLESDDDSTMVPMFLLPNCRLPIPKWMYKIVKVDYRLYAFITYNNIFDDEEPVPPCPVVECPPDLRLKQNKKEGYTYCCEPKKFISCFAPSHRDFLMVWD